MSHRAAAGCPSLTNGFTWDGTRWQAHSNIYNRLRGEDFEYLGLEAENDGHYKISEF